MTTVDSALDPRRQRILTSIVVGRALPTNTTADSRP
jgi:hypothetical protein